MMFIVAAISSSEELKASPKSCSEKENAQRQLLLLTLNWRVLYMHSTFAVQPGGWWLIGKKDV